MAPNRSNSNVTTSKSRAQQRMEAFLGPRVARSHGEEVQIRALQQRFAGEELTEEFSPAEHRLQQLQQFRRMKQVAMLTPTRPVRRSAAFGPRDVATPGQ